MYIRTIHYGNGIDGRPVDLRVADLGVVTGAAPKF